MEVTGFGVGLLSQWSWGQTLSRVTVRDCREVGLRVSATAVGVEDLRVEGTPLAVDIEHPNEWTWWGGVVALHGGRFSGGNPTGPAIRVRGGVLYAKDVAAEGFGSLIDADTPGGNLARPMAAEYLSSPAKTLGDAPPHAVALPVKPEPDIPWETDPAKWVCANDHGATAGDGTDDTAAFQKAIDAAAAGATTVFLRGIGGGDPNWYTLDGEVRVHGSVRRVIALGFGRVLGGENGRFVVDDDSAPAVEFRGIDPFGGPPPTLVNRSVAHALVAESCGASVRGDGGGDLFLTNCSARVELRRPGQSLWARQLNPEGDDDNGLVQNAGGNLWAVGVKCEGRGVRFRTTDGGRTAIYGMFLYGPGTPDGDSRPIFDVADADFSIAGLREIAFGGNCYPVKVRVTRSGEIRGLTSETEDGWIGWSLFRTGSAD